jgi:hypothetical protein
MKYLKYAGLAFAALVAIGYFVPGSERSHQAADFSPDTPSCAQARSILDAARKIGSEKDVKAAVAYAQIDVDPNPIKDCLAGK